MIIHKTLWRSYLSNKRPARCTHTDTNRFLAMKVTTQHEDYLISRIHDISAIDFFFSFNLMQHRAPKTILKYNDGHILSRITLTSYN